MGHLKVANFKRFQSADIVKKSEGRPPWVKQWREFWMDYELSGLRADVRLLALFLVSFASEFLKEFPGDDEMGTFPNDIQAISRRVSLPASSVRKGVATLTQMGFLVAIDSREVSREDSLENRALEVEVDTELLGRDNGSGRETAPSPVLETFEVDPGWELEVVKLRAAITEADEGTLAVFRKEAKGLPVGAIAKVRESAKGKPAKYATRALQSEKRELEQRRKTA